MTLQELIDGLAALGFTEGFAAGGNPAEIILWENEDKQPSMKQISDAVSLGAYNREVEQVKQQRHNAYVAPGGSDAILAKYLRDEATKQEWLDAVQAINDANPYPVKEGK
jgi:hypothetical protein